METKNVSPSKLWQMVVTEKAPIYFFSLQIFIDYFNWITSSNVPEIIYMTLNVI